MMYMMIRCRKCNGTGRISIPRRYSTEQRSIDFFNRATGAPDKVAVSPASTLKCLRCDGTGIFRVELPALTESDLARAAVEGVA